MRKLSVILILLAVVVSSAFCANLRENHGVLLKTNVSGEDPAFQFEFTSGYKYAKNDIVTNASAEKFNEDSDYTEYATQKNAVDVADISRYSLDLVFTAKLANNAKCNASYTLTFIADGFDVTRKSVPGKLNPESVSILAAEDIAARQGVVAGTIVSGESIKMLFTGALCETGSLATFEVRYHGDETIDPATYYTDITLEITSDS